jgi:SAM-dependent methyltransferase
VGYFDRWAPSYDHSWTQRLFFGPVHRGVAKTLAPLVPAPRRILDIGCGTGALLRLLGDRYPQADLTGVDASKEMIRVASDANLIPERLRFLHAAAEELPVGDAGFDLILSTISFHHWADQKQGLSEVARALLPNGRFLLADHFVTPLQQVFFATPARRKRFHSATEIDGMLAAAGLEDQRWHRIYAVGPLLIVSGVTARRPPLGSPPVKQRFDNSSTEAYREVGSTGN